MTNKKRLECFGTATSQDACLQCPDNNECVAELIRREQKRFSWANRPLRKKEIVSDPISGCQITSLVIPSIQDYEIWLEGFGKELDAVKQLAKEVQVDPMSFDFRKLKKLLEAVQNL